MIITSNKLNDNYSNKLNDNDNYSNKLMIITSNKLNCHNIWNFWVSLGFNISLLLVFSQVKNI